MNFSLFNAGAISRKSTQQNLKPAAVSRWARAIALDPGESRELRGKSMVYPRKTSNIGGIYPLNAEDFPETAFHIYVGLLQGTGD